VSSGDKWFFGFITLWIILCAGEPDLLDAISKRIAGEIICNVKEN
jgi:hypothetical protein